VVIDVRTPYRTVPVRVYLFNAKAFATGHEPFTRWVSRPVISPAVAFGALQRLFAGPTQADRSHGLSFLASKATGFKLRSIRDGVARVQLTGACSSGGSTATVALEIMPTLKQFPSVHWVKIYDQAGRTGRSTGHTDSIPDCLNP
jgi:spore germination protein GerM